MMKRDSHHIAEPTGGRRAAKIGLVGGLILLALWIDRHLLTAPIWAVILAIATGPVHERLAQRHPRLRSGLLLPSLFTALFALAVLIPLAVIVAEAAREQADVMQWIASARANGVPAPAWVAQLPVGSDWIGHWWQANLATPDAAARALGRVQASAIHQTGVWGGEILHRIFVFALALLSYFFLLRERETIVAQLRVAGDRLLGPTGERVAKQVILSVRGTINGLVFVGLGEGAVMTILYWISGAPHPVLLGALTAVAAMIPFGAILMFLVAALLLLGQGALAWAIAVIVAGLVVVGIADHFVRPALIGGATRLPFALVLFGILGGVETLGLLGLFVGPGTMAALVMLWREYARAPVTGAPEPGPELPQPSAAGSG
ncbi:MAG TPA: AI-2E family transporter [Allosphingosinicella sp.]|nr:AI-2E family transporter [Allosphingosinicella sp.]